MMVVDIMNWRKYTIPLDYYKKMDPDIFNNPHIFHGEGIKLREINSEIEVTTNKFSDSKKYVVYNTSKYKKILAFQNSLFLMAPNLDLIVTKGYFTLNEKIICAEESASKRAELAYYSTGLPSISSDTGFEIEELNGWPGIEYNNIIKTKGIESILGMLTKQSQKAKWTRVTSYFDGKTEKPTTFISESKGIIMKQENLEIPKEFKSNIINYYFMQTGGPAKVVADLTPAEYRDQIKKDKYENLIKHLVQKQKEGMLWK